MVDRLRSGLILRFVGSSDHGLCVGRPRPGLSRDGVEIALRSTRKQWSYTIRLLMEAHHRMASMRQFNSASLCVIAAAVFYRGTARRRHGKIRMDKPHLGFAGNVTRIANWLVRHNGSSLRS